LKHLLIALGHPLAIVGALLADLGACPACQAVKRTAPRHEIGTGSADLSAIQQHADMSLIRMLAADTQTMGDSLQADDVAFSAVTDALVHADSHGIPFRIGWVVTHPTCRIEISSS
jgi:hypothetical protein